VQFLAPTSGCSFVLSFVAQDQTNMSADSLGVAINKPSREVLGPAALYICVLDRLHFDLLVEGVWKETVVDSEKAHLRASLNLGVGAVEVAE
jgi:hypothetical protein